MGVPRGYLRFVHIGQAGDVNQGPNVDRELEYDGQEDV